MKLSDGVALVAAYEKQAAKYKAAVEARKELLAKLGSDTMGKLVDAFPTLEAFTGFAAAMPESPALDAVVKAFPDPKKMTEFIEGALKGNIKVFAVLAEKGCGRDPAVLKQLADEFSLDPSALQNMVTEGGMGNQPEALAAMLQDGCGSNPVTLKKVFAEFGTKQDRERLAKSLGEGGLGGASGTLAALVKHDEGKLLKKLTADFETEPEKLRGVVTEGGCDGKSPGRPELLTDVIVKGLGGDPKRLKELHAAFTPGGNNQLKDLNKLLTGLDGEDAKGGDRLKGLLDIFAAQTGNNMPNAAKKLQDPYITSISKLSMTGGMPDVTGAKGAAAGTKAASERTPPPAEQRAGTLGSAIDAKDVGALAQTALTDAAARTAAGTALATAGGLTKAGEDIAKRPLAGDPAQTQKTADATKQANDKLAEVAKRVDGAPAADIEALAKLGAAALEAARIEPDDNTRKAALAAAKAVEEGVIEALKRLAAATLAGSPNGASASAAQAAVAALPKDAPAGVQKAAKDTAQAAMAAAAAANGAQADPAISSAAAKEAIKNAGPSGEQAKREKAANDAATEATKAAEAMKTLVEKASRPVEPALLGRAADTAALCVDRARGAPDQPTATAGFDAAKLLTKAINDAIKEATARLTLAATQASADGKAALAAADGADVATDIVNRLAGTSAIKTVGLQQLEKAAAAARNVALTAADSEKMLASDKAAQKQQAEDAAYRYASAAKSGAHSPQDVTQAVGKGNTDATNAAQAATLATQALTGYAGLANLDKPNQPAARQNYVPLIEDAAEKAEAALAAARGAADDTARTNALNAAKAAAVAVAAASKLLSAALEKMADAELKTERNTKVANGTGRADALATAIGTVNEATARTQAQAAFDAGKAAIADSAAAALGAYARDPTVAAANQKVAEALANANLPGADEAAKLALVLAKRDAAKAMHVKAKDALANAKAALPAPATGPAAPVPEATAQAYANALTTGKAANTACLAWHAAALEAEKVAKAFQTALTAVKNPSAAETKALQAATLAVGAAGTEVTNAANMMVLVGQTIEAITTDSKKWSQRANGHGGATNGNKLAKDVAGFAVSMGEDANSKSYAMPETDLIRMGASMKKDPITGPAIDNATAGTEPGTMDKEHVCDRHVRSTYHFDGESLPNRSDHDVGMLLDGALSGKPGKSNEQKDLIKQGGRNKPNSFLPEAVIQTNLKTWIEAAFTEVAKAGKISDQLHTDLISPLPKTWSKVWLERVVTVPKPPADPPTPVTIGISIDSDPGTPLLAPNCKPKARMFYANTRDKVSTPDMLVLSKALNYAT